MAGLQEQCMLESITPQILAETPHTCHLAPRRAALWLCHFIHHETNSDILCRRQRQLYSWVDWSARWCSIDALLHHLQVQKKASGICTGSQ